LAGLRQLSEACQELLRLFFGAGLTTNEVAVALDVAPGTVRVRKARCLERLRRVPEIAVAIGKEALNE
jgi:RNA polymerase sigma factor (sigma-70 family)